MNTLRFITAGNVDDGKSTLIGRLLYDSDSIHTDHLGLIKKQSTLPDEAIDLSLITDGLRAEREQGITIDVAYKYFSTSKRKFIIADSPGHEQYTRNMVTGASNSDLIIILIDARKGITGQTRRHSRIASLMGIKKAVIAINKIDLVNYSEDVYLRIVQDFEAIKSDLSFDEIVYLPVNAFGGDNVVTLSAHTPWYTGKSLLSILSEIELPATKQLPPRFQVQWVIRPKSEEHHDYRGYAGPILSGSYAVGDIVRILPSDIETEIVSIEKSGQPIQEAFAGDNVVLHFEGNIDISRGDTIVKTGDSITGSSEIETWVSWLDAQALQSGKTYLLQHRFRQVRAKVVSVGGKWDIKNWAFTAVDTIGLNDIGRLTLKVNQPLFYDDFNSISGNGNAILIDESSFTTVAGLMFIKN